MRLNIVEDEVIVADDLADIIQQYGITKIDLFHSYAEGLASIKNPADAYILDIRLGDGNGVDLGSKLSQLEIPFIYITANNEVDIIKKAVQTKPVAYISKPFKDRDVIAAIELLKSKNLNATVELNTSKGKISVNTNDILFCKADDVYVEIITENKKAFIAPVAFKITLLHNKNHTSLTYFFT